MGGSNVSGCHENLLAVNPLQIFRMTKNGRKNTDSCIPPHNPEFCRFRPSEWHLNPHMDVLAKGALLWEPWRKRTIEGFKCLGMPRKLACRNSSTKIWIVKNWSKKHRFVHPPSRNRKNKNQGGPGISSQGRSCPVSHHLPAAIQFWLSGVFPATPLGWLPPIPNLGDWGQELELSAPLLSEGVGYHDLYGLVRQVPRLRNARAKQDMTDPTVPHETKTRGRHFRTSPINGEDT